MFRVDDILEGQKGDQGGGPKKAKIQYGVKPDIFKITWFVLVVWLMVWTTLRQTPPPPRMLTASGQTA